MLRPVQGGGFKASDFHVFETSPASAYLHWGPESAKGGCVQASEIYGFADIGELRLVDSEESKVYVGRVESFQNAAVKWIA